VHAFEKHTTKSRSQQCDRGAADSASCNAVQIVQLRTRGVGCKVGDPVRLPDHNIAQHRTVWSPLILLAAPALFRSRNLVRASSVLLTSPVSESLRRPSSTLSCWKIALRMILHLYVACDGYRFGSRPRLSTAAGSRCPVAQGQ
jgi:hypothetical protein